MNQDDPHRRTSPASPGATAAGIAALAALYFVAAKLGLRLAVVHPSATAVWPPTGIALAALLRFGPRLWPGIAAGAFFANVTTAGSLATSAGISAGNTLEGLLGAWLVSRFAGGANSLRRPGDVFRFVTLAAGLSTIVSATVGVLTLSVTGYARWSMFGPIWTTWWLGDTVGALVVAPPLLLWSTMERPRFPRRLIEASGAALLFALTSLIYFRDLGSKNAPIEWAWIPLLVWVAYRFGPRAGSTTVLAVAVVAIAGATRSAGLFGQTSPNSSLLLLQAFLGVVSVMTLTLSAVVSANERAMVELADAHDELERRVRDRTEALSRANESLESEIAQRRRLQRELIDAGEVERQRLGRDLHDDLGQILAGIGFLMSALERKAVSRGTVEAADLEEIQAHLHEAISKTRRIARELTSVSLGTGGLGAAIQDLARMTERVFDVRVSVRCDPSVFVDRPIAATNLYRIVQEAVSNAARHGRGQRIKVSLALDRDDLVVSVRDDGVGMDPGDARREGLGLRNMRSRAESLGGRLVVESGRDGTTVTCVVPHAGRRLPAERQPGP